MPEAGWYWDPANHELHRYWDGQQWTKRIRTKNNIGVREWPAEVPVPPFSVEVEASRQRRNRSASIVLIVALLIIAGALIVPHLTGSSSDPSASTTVKIDDGHQGGGGNPIEDPTVHVVYLLKGHAPGGADITYSLGGNDGSSEQQNGLTVPMTNKKTGRPGIRFDAQPGDFLYFSAQNQGGGHLTCEILEDGVVLVSHTSSGQYAIVTCSSSA